MRYVTLTTTANQYSDTLGFKLADCPDFEGFVSCRTGLSIAHDVVEHQNGPRNMGPVWDELEALGGVWYTRGQFGFPESNRYPIYSPEQDVANDIAWMFGDWTCDFTPAHAFAPSKPHWADESFEEIIEKARKLIAAEANQRGGEEAEQASVDEYLKLALHRLRSGFRKASKRWERNHDDMHALRQFKAIRDAVAKAVPLIEIEGQEFRLGYGGGEARVIEIPYPF